MPDTPVMPGSASGLRNKPCMAAPAMPRLKPTSAPRIMRGIRSSTSTSAPRLDRPCSTSDDSLAQIERRVADRQRSCSQHDDQQREVGDQRAIGHALAQRKLLTARSLIASILRGRRRRRPHRAARPPRRRRDRRNSTAGRAARRSSSASASTGSDGAAPPSPSTGGPSRLALTISTSTSCSATISSGICP